MGERRVKPIKFIGCIDNNVRDFTTGCSLTIPPPGRHRHDFIFSVRAFGHRGGYHQYYLKPGAGSTWSPLHRRTGSTWSPLHRRTGSTWSPLHRRAGSTWSPRNIRCRPFRTTFHDKHLHSHYDSRFGTGAPSEGFRGLVRVVPATPVRAKMSRNRCVKASFIACSCPLR
jgi:hypothetical protein